MARALRAPRSALPPACQADCQGAGQEGNQGGFSQKKHPTGKFLTTLIMGLLSESVMVLAEGRETHCIFCLVTGFLHKFLSIPDAHHQLK